jgi:hypothetical protein
LCVLTPALRGCTRAVRSTRSAHLIDGGARGGGHSRLLRAARGRDGGGGEESSKVAVDEVCRLGSRHSSAPMCATGAASAHVHSGCAALCSVRGARQSNQRIMRAATYTSQSRSCATTV